MSDAPDPSHGLAEFIPWAIAAVCTGLTTAVGTLFNINFKLMTSRIEVLESNVKSSKEHIDKLEEARVVCESERSSLKSTCEHLKEIVNELRNRSVPGDSK
jgi:hypothetical protein